jgi:hypothetical protein
VATLTMFTETADWVRTHQVCWEFQPLKEMVKGTGVRQTGLELLLYAQHGGAPHLDPVAPEHTEMFVKLHELAEHVLPPGHTLAHFAIEPFDSSEHLRPETGWEPEVQVRVMITPEDPEVSIDKALVAEIERRLRDLGAQPRVWAQAPGGEE